MRTLLLFVLSIVAVTLVQPLNNVVGFGSNTGMFTRSVLIFLGQIQGRNTGTTVLVNPGTIVGTFPDTFVSASIGNQHAVFLTQSGLVYGTGYSFNGRLGLNDSAAPIAAYYGTLVPMVDGNKVLVGKKVIAAEASGHSSVLLTDDGKVFTYGWNDNAGLGVSGTSTIHYSPKPINDTNGLLVGKTVKHMSVSNDAVLLVTNDGLVRSFGFNGNYNLGDGTGVNQNIVTALPFTGRVIVQTSIGLMHSLALQDSGTVLSWGFSINPLGRSGSHLVPAPIEDPNNVIGSRKVVYISAGFQHSILLTDDGRAFTFGNGNPYGQMCTGDTTTYTRLQPFAASANSLFFTKAKAGYQTTLMLTNDGRVYACGENALGTTGLNNTATGPTSPTLLATLGGFYSGLATNIHLSVTGTTAGFVIMSDNGATPTPTTIAPGTTSSPGTTATPTTAPTTAPTPTAGTTNAPQTISPTATPKPTTSGSVAVYSSIFCFVLLLVCL
jgi:alpha-tubulin suppressor-like RCC1 family protein